MEASSQAQQQKKLNKMNTVSHVFRHVSIRVIGGHRRFHAVGLRRHDDARV